ncbi:MAG: hypothetical protein VXY82_09730, partial [Planctomycetota bacterium]|nr:hypothetical protein [Planctomycetota bacterium]
ADWFLIDAGTSDSRQKSGQFSDGTQYFPPLRAKDGQGENLLAISFQTVVLLQQSPFLPRTAPKLVA